MRDPIAIELKVMRALYPSKVAWPINVYVSDYRVQLMIKHGLIRIVYINEKLKIGNRITLTDEARKYYEVYNLLTGENHEA